MVKRLWLILLFLPMGLAAQTSWIPVSGVDVTKAQKTSVNQAPKAPIHKAPIVRDTALTYIQMPLDSSSVIHPQRAYGAIPDLVPTAIEIIQKPYYGSIELTDSTITYTPNHGYTGPDQMLCQLTDAQGRIQLVKVMLDVTDELTFSGQEFYFTYIKNAHEPFCKDMYSWQCKYRIITLIDTRAYITDDKGANSVVDIPANTYYEYSVIGTSSNAHDKRAFHIETSAPVVVEAANYDDACQDVTGILPLHVLGTDYIINAPHWGKPFPPTFNIVGTEDNTTIEINLTLSTMDHTAGTPYTIHLNKGETYVLKDQVPYSSSYNSASYHTISGSTIHSNKPIAVFQGCAGTILCPPKGASGGAIDHMYEQALPASLYGTQFVAMGNNALSNDYFELVTPQDSVNVKIDGRSYVLNTYQTLDTIVYQNSIYYIESDKPIGAEFFTDGGEFQDGYLGDPSQTLMASTNLGGFKSVFTCERVTEKVEYPDVLGDRQICINVVVPTRATASMLLDGVPMTGFQPVKGCDSLSVGRYRFPSNKEAGVHTLENKEARFVGHSYGFRRTEAFTFNLPPVRLEEIPRYEVTDYDTICYGEMYVWHDRSYYDTGFYTDSLKTTLGFDSITHLDLTVWPRYDRIVEQPDTSYKDNANQRGVLPTVWNDPFMPLDNPSRTQRDSILPSVWTDPYMSQVFHDTTCLGIPYEWHNNLYTETGLYTDTLLTIHGCDSVVYLNLLVIPEATDTLRDTICDKFEYSWRGKIYTEDGVYNDTVSIFEDCDSLYTLVLTVLPTSRYDTTITACHGDSAFVFGHWYLVPETDSLMVCDTLHYTFGCDSFYNVVHFTLTEPFDSMEYKNIYEGDSVFWRGYWYADAGTYTDFTPKQKGCDTIFRLTTTIIPYFRKVETACSCNNAVYWWHGRPLLESGTYTDTLTAMNGHDSVCVLNLQVFQSYLIWPEHDIPSEQGPDNDPDPGWWDNPGITEGIIPADTVCGTQFVWHGHVLTENGEYFDTIPSSHGCDSLVWINLVLMNCCDSTPVVTDTTIAYGSSMEWFGNTYSQSGIYNDTLPGEPCDSIGQLILHVTYSDTVYTCDMEPVTFVTPFGNWESRDCDTLTGCLSAAPDGTCLVEGSLYVVRLLADSIAEDTTVCEGAIVRWHGQSILGEGTFYDTIPYRTQSTCDSLYCRITIHRSSAVETQIADTVCFGADYEWHGQTITDITEDRVLKDVLSTTAGCDSVVVLTVHPEDPPITIMTNATICAGTTYTWHTYRDQTFSTQGMYEDTLWTERGCFSQTYALSLLVTTCACDTAKTHTYRQLEEDELPYEWNGHMLQQLPLNETRDTVFVFPTRREDNSCDSISNMHIHVLEPCEIKSIYLPESWNEEKK